MPKDIKKIASNYRNTHTDLPLNHRVRFEQKLQKEFLHKKKSTFPFFKIAAGFIFFIGLSFAVYTHFFNETPSKENYTLGSLSPELKKIENYYTNAINYELAKIRFDDKNTLILNKYFNKLEELTLQYKKESALLSIDSIDEKSINALIDNLQLRLQLLLQLKEQLKIIKPQKNENKHI